jgi:ABC-type transporter Mla maintaining outer membrane lipid asymmetry ATPase subunit MlaF
MPDEPTQGMPPSETAEIDALIKSLAGTQYRSMRQATAY